MENFIRVWQTKDLLDIEKHLIVVGELSSECFCCHQIGLDSKSRACPDCKAYFKYMGFRRKLQPAYLQKVLVAMPNIILIDFDDFKKARNKRDARNLLNM